MINYKKNDLVILNNFSLLDFIKKYWSCLLILLTFASFISKSFYNYPMGLMAILGLYRIVCTPKMVVEDPVLKTLTVVFLCLWLPQLASLIDAVNFQASAKTVFPYLRYFFAGVFIVEEVTKDYKRLNFIIGGIFYIVCFWCIDGIIQLMLGKNLVGFQYDGYHITGMFHPKYTIGHICAVLSTYFFLYIYLNAKEKVWLLLAIPLLLFVILVSGRRAAWILLAFSATAFLIYGYIYADNKKLFISVLGITGFLLGAIFTSTAIFHEPTKQRLEKTIMLFSTEKTSINYAISQRIPIWESTYEIFKLHPINGIGPRGFRHFYTDYATWGAYYEAHNISPTHPHIFILEILAETGLIGLLGYLTLQLILFIKILKINNRKILIPFYLAVFIAFFPLNTHRAFYGSIWSSIAWLLTYLYIAKMKLIQQQTNSAHLP